MAPTTKNLVPASCVLLSFAEEQGNTPELPDQLFWHGSSTQLLPVNLPTESLPCEENSANIYSRLLKRTVMSSPPKKALLLSSFLAILAFLILTLFFLLKGDRLLPVKIGIVLPLTGDFATYGILGIQGAEMAVEEINSGGGLLKGRPLQLIIEDNQSDPYLSVTLMRKLIQKDDVLAVMGPVSSPARNAMTEVARQFKVPLLYGIDYEGGSYDRYLFCYSPIPEHVITPLIPYLKKRYGSKVYIFGYDYIWPHEMAKAITEEVEKSGGKIIGTEFTPFGVADFTPTIEKIRNSGADVLILVMCGTDGIRFAAQFNRAGMKEGVQLVAIAAEETWQQALSREELEGIITPIHFLSSLDLEDTQSFVTRQKQMFGNETVVTYSTESHYGLIMLLRKAIEKVGSVDDREKLIDAMENLQISVGNGSVRMREDHHMDLNMMIGVFHDGMLLAKEKIGLVKPKDQRRER